MPELPEVQTTVNGLNKKIKKRRITGVWFDAPKLVKNIKASELEKKIKGLKIIEAERRGKNILIYLSEGYLLLIHMKMTGHLLYGKWDVEKTSDKKHQASSRIKGVLQERVNNYIHFIFYLDNGYQFALSDLRKFAKIVFGKAEEIEKLPDLTELGPEPLDKNFNVKKFIKLIKSKNGKIKQVLMDPKVIAGIGNIYSDEILWSAKVNPLRKASELREPEVKKIYSETKKILKKALRLGGTSISDYRDFSGKPGFYSNERLVYRMEGRPCRRCGTAIKRVKMGGRSTRFCPVCQK